nr:hypothetical protein CFP56_12141 [Quercus suber]
MNIWYTATRAQNPTAYAAQQVNGRQCNHDSQTKMHCRFGHRHHFDGLRIEWFVQGTLLSCSTNLKNQEVVIVFLTTSGSQKLQWDGVDWALSKALDRGVRSKDFASGADLSSGAAETTQRLVVQFILCRKLEHYRTLAIILHMTKSPFLIYRCHRSFAISGELVWNIFSAHDIASVLYANISRFDRLCSPPPDPWYHRMVRIIHIWTRRPPSATQPRSSLYCTSRQSSEFGQDASSSISLERLFLANKENLTLIIKQAQCRLRSIGKGLTLLCGAVAAHRHSQVSDPGLVIEQSA